MFDHHADIVPIVGVVPVRGIGRGFALQRVAVKAQILDPRDAESTAVQRERVVIDPTVLRQHGKQRKTAGQILPDHFAAIDFERLCGFAQHQQAGRMIDLAVDQNDGLDAGVPNAVFWVGRREVLKLSANIG